MSRFDPAEFGRLLAGLTPYDLRQTEGMVAEARERAEAVLEIDARAEAGGPASSCPSCDGDARIRWGRTRTGAQRWSCSGCGVTWPGRASGTQLAWVHRPDLVVSLARDMSEAPKPMSCRRAAEVLGVSIHSIWRWPMRKSQIGVLHGISNLISMFLPRNPLVLTIQKGNSVWSRGVLRPLRRRRPVISFSTRAKK